MKIKNYIQKIIALASVVLTLSCIFSPVSYAASESFTVDGNKENGYVFENTTGHEQTFSFTAEGEWSIFRSGEDNWFGPNGDPTNESLNIYGPEDLKHSEFVVASLLAENEGDRGVSEIGNQGTITIPKDGSATLLMNDVPGTYGDNRGLVTVEVNWDEPQS